MSCLFLLLICSSVSAAQRIAVLYSAHADVFVQMAQHLKATDLADTEWLLYPTGTNEKPAAPVDLVIAVGQTALSESRHRFEQTPVLAILLSQLAYDKWRTTLDHTLQSSAIFQDPPVYRQLLLTTLLLPHAKRIGFLYDNNDAEHLSSLKRDAAQLHLHLSTRHTEQDNSLSASLTKLLPHCDVILTSANSQLYNAQTIKNILTLSYHSDRVLIGTSPALVKAGSLATTYSNNEHIAKQVREWLVQWRMTPHVFPAPEHARYFDISLNTDVARSLNIPLPDQQQLLSLLRKREANKS